jgi:hypothetical protein
LGGKMRPSISRICAITAVAIIVPVVVLSQTQVKSLVLAGHEGSVPVRQIRRKNYVEVAALAQMANGSIIFNGDQMTLTLPSVPENVARAASPNPAVRAGFSREFLNAAIQEMSAIREWRNTLANAIANQIPLGQAGLGQYQAQASTNLRLTQVAVATDSDRSAAQLFANDYGKMKQLNDKYVAQAASLSYIPTDSLGNDQLDQSIIACGQSLESMTATGQFVDNGACN